MIPGFICQTEIMASVIFLLSDIDLGIKNSRVHVLNKS